MPPLSSILITNQTSNQSQHIISINIALEKIYKKNKKLYSKIEDVLGFVKPIIETGVSPNSVKPYSSQINESKEYHQKLNIDHFHIKAPISLMALRSNLPCRYELKLDYTKALDKPRNQVLKEIKLWNMRSTNHISIIRVLENYKTFVMRIIKLESGEDPYTRLFENLYHLKDEAEIKKYKIPPYFFWPSKSGHQIQLSKDSTFLQREYSKSLGGKESPWLQYEYFSAISKPIIGNFEEIIDQILPSNNIQFLSMHSINRLVAIAKMLNYCRVFKINLLQFQQGRIKQKIIALETKRKLFLTEQKIFHNKNLLEAIEEYPSVEELSYLLTLDISKLDDIISNLKENLEYIPDNCEYKLKEQVFKLYLENNNKRRRKLIQRILTESASGDNDDFNNIILKYQTMIPTIIKKRAKGLANIYKDIKKPKYEEIQKTVKSITGQSDESSKNYSKKLKEVFKVIHIENISENYELKEINVAKK